MNASNPHSHARAMHMLKIAATVIDAQARIRRDSKHLTRAEIIALQDAAEQQITTIMWRKFNEEWAD